MERASGVLLHISSLPNKYGVGSLGKSAYEFVDFLAASKQKYWQVLPLNQTGYGDSPYQSCSAYSLSPYFIDLDFLCRQKLLKKTDFSSVDFGDNSGVVDYYKLFKNRFEVLKIAYKNYDKTDKEFVEFLGKGEFFDYAMFMSLKYYHGQKVWQEWGDEYKNRDENALSTYYENNKDDVDFWQFLQFIFLKQWVELKQYANKKGIQIIGDMPIYVASDSVEVWTQKDNFLLDENGYPTVVAGCPPDAFCDGGQLWGNPIYDWEFMKKNNYEWWLSRLINASKMFDRVRIDHFRGFSGYYTVQSGAVDARAGVWKCGPGATLFEQMGEKIPELDIIAEDLGYIDDECRNMLAALQYPGMKVLLFGFDDRDENEHKPHNFVENSVAYIGTHDNETLVDFIKKSDRKQLLKVVKKELEYFNLELKGASVSAIASAITELAFASAAGVSIVTMQDLLQLDGYARMNFPSTLSTDNWSFKLKSNSYKRQAERLTELTLKYSR